MMNRRLATLAGALSLAALALAGPLRAEGPDPENVLVIEIEGRASGTVKIELLPEVAPLHVERMRMLAREGAYDDVVFHRVIDGFMAQTGDVLHGKEGGDLAQAGFGGSEYGFLPAEFSRLPFVEGVVGMARGPNPNSANSQFFIMFGRAPHLNGQYTVVGRVIEGQEVVNAITRWQQGSPGRPDVMRRVQVLADM